MKRSFLLLTLLVFAAILGSALLVVFFSIQPTALAPLPNPNGYDVLLNATSHVTGKIDNFSELDHDRLLALVASNKESLRLIRFGLSQSCAVPTDTQISSFSSMSHDLIGLKSLARILSAEGCLAEMENRNNDAAQSYLDQMRLGCEMSKGGFMVNRLVGIACEGMGNNSMVKLLPKLTCEQIKPLITELQKVDDDTVPWREIMKNENQYVRAQTGGYHNPIKFLSDLWQSRKMRKVSEDRHDSAAAHLRLVMVELALRTFRCDHGIAPEDLNRLIPNYLNHLPIDPFSGKMPIYHPAGTNWVLYSLGPYRVDDKGKPVGKSISDDTLFFLGSNSLAQDPMKGDLFYDSKW